MDDKMILKLSKEQSSQVKKDELKHPTHIKISDFFHVIDHCGQLLNKQSPAKDDKEPCQLFKKYAQVHESKEGDACGDIGRYIYVEAEDIPNIIFLLFKDKPDQKRVDLAEILSKMDFSQNKSMIEHIVQQIWD